MKTYVVNMLKDKEKRATIEKQLAQHPELDYQIWKAVEGKRLTEQEQKEMIFPDFKQRYGRGGNLPAAGCSLSHDGIYRDMIDNDIPYALILEDDAVLAFNLYVDEYVELLDRNEPTAIMLTSDFWYHINDKIKDVDSKHAIYKVKEAYMTSGYLINKAAAKIIFDHNYPVQYLADSWEQFAEFGIELYGIVPHVTTYTKGVIGEIGLESGDYRRRQGLGVKQKLVKLYFKIQLVKRYLQGYRKSQVLWWFPEDNV